MTSAPLPIKTTCPYCGVGCGIDATILDAGERRLQIRGDRDHPANFGRLCSKGSALAETMGLEGRLLHPYIGDRRVSWDQALDQVARGFRETLEQHGPDALALYVSGQLLTEDYYVANKLMKGCIGSANIDTNSRLCMSSAVAGYKRAFGADAVPCCYEDLEQAELVVLVGSNTAWCHPVLYQRLQQAKKTRPELKVIVVDPRRTATCDLADLHLALKPGSDVTLFNGLLVQLAAGAALDRDFIEQHTEGFAAALAQARRSSPDIATVAAACGLSAAGVNELYQAFIASEKVVTLYSQGVNQSSSGTDKSNSIINCHLASGRLGRPGTGPFSITGQPNAMGGREVGGLANMLAAHMELDNPTHVDRVRRFWHSERVADRPGLKAVELFQAIEQGRIQAVWIIATNPVVSLPDADQVKRALARCPLVVVSDCIGATDTAAFAHITLPAAGWGEKEGTVTNSERRISKQRKLLEAAGESRPDWWIISEVGRRMGYDAAFPFRSNAEVFREHALLSGFENDPEHGLRDFDISALGELSEQDYHDLKPVQWPLKPGQSQPQPRLFGDRRFFTTSGKARFIALEPRPPAHPTNTDYPFVLNTGRVRDQWHTMTRTALAPKLNLHSPEPYVEIHPDDSARLNLPPHGLARISTRWGSMLARIQVSPAQRPGCLFVPIHWSDQLSLNARVGALVNPVVDPLSGQPESKHTPARIEAFQARWYAMLLARQPLQLEACEYRVRIPGDGYQRYEIASNAAVPDWRAWSRSVLAATAPADGNWIEYSDREAGCYRAAALSGERLESCLFIAPTPTLPDPGWLATLFRKPELDKAERLSLLSGKPPKGQEDVGAIICSCFNVGEKTIRRAIRERQLDSAEAIGACLKAGTNCGSCLPELKALLAGMKTG